MSSEDFLIRDLNEWDDFSLEEAVKIKEGVGRSRSKWSRCRCAPESADESLRKCLAKGADRAIRVWDEASKDSDPIAIARVLAAVAEARVARFAVRRRAVLRSFIRIHRHRHRGAARLAACGGRERAHLLAGSEERGVPPRARRWPAARDRDQCPAVLDHSAWHQYAALRLAAQHQAGGRQADRGQVAGRSRGRPRQRSARPVRLSRVRRMYIPEKGRAQLIEGDAAAAGQAARARSSASSKETRHERHPCDRRAAARRTAPGLAGTDRRGADAQARRRRVSRGAARAPARLA